MPGEGKSLINILLAKTLSEQGLKILQIDADLRKPQLHYRLGVNNLQGLSNILTDKSIDWKDCLNEIEFAKILCNNLMNEYYEILKERINEYEKNPPPENWDGVYVATSK